MFSYLNLLKKYKYFIKNVRNNKHFSAAVVNKSHQAICNKQSFPSAVVSLCKLFTKDL